MKYINTTKLQDTFKAWKKKKDERLLTLYQSRKECETMGENTIEIDEKISNIETEISQKKAKLDHDLLKTYQRMEKAGSSRSAKDARRERTHHLCNLGGLIEKAELGEMNKAALLGMLLQQKEYLNGNPGIQDRWAERGQAVLNAKEEEF